MNNVRIFLRVFVMSIFFSALQSGIGTVQGIDTEGDMNMSGVLEQDSHIAITERNAEVVAKVNLPGFDKKDINVRVKGDVLWIVANRSQKSETQTQNAYNKKIKQSNFEAMETLPCKVNASAIRWDLSKNGILTVTIPKA